MNVTDLGSIPRRGALTVMMSSWFFLPFLDGQSLPPAQGVDASLNQSTRQLMVVPADSSTQTPGQVIPASAILGARLPVQLGLTVTGYYDDNIYVRPDAAGKISDFIWSLAPLIAWNSAAQTGAVNSVQVAYAPTLIFYQEHSHNDTVNEAADVVYGFEGDKVELVVTEQFSQNQENNADFNTLGTETLSATHAELNYQVTGKTNLEVSARQTYTSDDPGLRSIEWTLSSYLDYQLSPKTTFGLGGVVGAVDLEGPNQTYEQVNGRVGYNPDAKLSISATAGGELRQTQGHSSSDATPDFSLGAAYEPFDGTNLGLSAYRRYEYSGRFYGDDYLATGVSASVSHRFLQRYSFAVSGAFEDAKYRDNFANAFASEGYDYFSIRPEVTYTPRIGWELRLFYQYRQSLAEGGVAGFDDNQAGLSASYTY